jgi:hypothetical protein
LQTRLHGRALIGDATDDHAIVIFGSVMTLDFERVAALRRLFNRHKQVHQHFR